MVSAPWLWFFGIVLVILVGLGIWKARRTWRDRLDDDDYPW